MLPPKRLALKSAHPVGQAITTAPGRPTGRLALTALALLAGICGFLRGESPSLTAAKVDRGPKVDGDLQDPAWKLASPFSAFKMVFPNPGSEPTERTELRILIDEADLYLGIQCFDRNPARVSALFPYFRL
jgi:hypothetical protein